MAAEFEVQGKQYRSTKMSARKQFHVARKLGPIFSKLGLGAVRKQDGEAKAFDMMDLLEPAVDALAEMSEADCDFVFDHCLAVVQVYDSNRWVNIWNDQAKRLAFEDIDLMVMIQISMHVLKDNLGNFINAPALTSSTSPEPGLNIPANSSLSPMARTGF